MTPGGARRAASRGVFAIEEEELLLPDPIAFDTSFVVEALIATQPLHTVCRAFLDRIDASGLIRRATCGERCCRRCEGNRDY